MIFCFTTLLVANKYSADDLSTKVFASCSHLSISWLVTILSEFPFDPICSFSSFNRSIFSKTSFANWFSMTTDFSTSSSASHFSKNFFSTSESVLPEICFNLRFLNIFWWFVSALSSSFSKIFDDKFSFEIWSHFTIILESSSSVFLLNSSIIASLSLLFLTTLLLKIFPSNFWKLVFYIVNSPSKNSLIEYSDSIKLKNPR